MKDLIYKNNIYALTRRYPRYAEAISSYSTNDSASCYIECYEDKNILTVSKDGQEYQLESEYSNELILDKIVSYMNYDVQELVVFMFGLGNGMYARRIFEEGTKQNDIKLFVYEPDIIVLGECIKHYDMSDIFDNENIVIIIPGYSDKKLIDYSKYIKLSNVRNIHSLHYMNYPHIFSEVVDSYDREIIRLVGRVQATGKLLNEAGEIYYQNTLDNYLGFANSYSLQSLKNCLPVEIPAVIVSSGPSLSKNIECLKMAKHKFFIMAVDSSLGALDNAGIIPDMYITVDPRKHRSNFSISNMQDVPVIGHITSPKYVYENRRHTFYTFTLDKYISEFMKDIVNTYGDWDMSAGGSVANTAMKICALLGFKTFILVGQDLAYTDNRAHAFNVTFDDDDMTEKMDETIDIYGSPILTSRTFLIYKRWFEDFIAKNEDIRVIDATEGGAYIEGTEVMKLETAILQFGNTQVNIDECIDKCEKLFGTVEKAKFADWLKMVPDRMNEIVYLSKKMLRNYERMELLAKQGKESSGEMKRLLNYNSELSELIENDPATTYINYINTESAEYIEDNVNSIDQNIRTDILNMCSLGKSHLKATIEAAERVSRDYSGVII